MLRATEDRYRWLSRTLLCILILIGVMVLRIAWATATHAERTRYIVVYDYVQANCPTLFDVKGEETATSSGPNL